MFENKNTIFQLPLQTQDLSGESLFLAASDAPNIEAEDIGVASEGELAVDVLETAEELVIVATMAGTRAEDIELHLHNDFLTIRGVRRAPIEDQVKYFYQECFWGRFSRTIVLPTDVRSEFARSEYKNGILTIHLPKNRPAATIPIMVIEE